MTDRFALRALNTDGITAVTRLLIDIDNGSSPEIDSLINSEKYSSALDDIEIERRTFVDRLDAGRYFYETLAPLRRGRTDVLRHKGLWTWLALSWIDILAPVSPQGTRKLFDSRRWVLAVDDYQAYYRHHFAGPYSVYAAHADDPSRAMALLCGTVATPGEVWEQIASRQDFASSPTLVELATRLYFDPATKKLKPGSGSKGAGSPRRLPTVIEQFGLTWDVRGMPVDRLLGLLPSEFDRFK
jgi:hypothetical protein